MSVHPERKSRSDLGWSACSRRPSCQAWLTAPHNKPDVLRLTSQAKSDSKYGKVAVLVYAADLGPERADGNRQGLRINESACHVISRN